jgi:hypothetical protein
MDDSGMGERSVARCKQKTFLVPTVQVCVAWTYVHVVVYFFRYWIVCAIHMGIISKTPALKSLRIFESADFRENHFEQVSSQIAPWINKT